MAINHRILQIDATSCQTILSNPSPVGNGGLDQTTLKQWCLAKGITGIKWETDTTNPNTFTQLRALIHDMRAIGIKDHSWVSSGTNNTLLSPASGGTVVTPYPNANQDLTTSPFGYKIPRDSDVAAGPLSTGNTYRFFAIGSTLSPSFYKNSGADLQFNWNSFRGATTTSAGSIPRNITTWTYGYDPLSNTSMLQVNYATLSPTDNPFPIGSIVSFTGGPNWPGQFSSSGVSYSIPGYFNMKAPGAFGSGNGTGGVVTQQVTPYFAERAIYIPKMENGMRALYRSDNATNYPGFNSPTTRIQNSNSVTSDLGTIASVDPLVSVRTATRTDMGRSDFASSPGRIFSVMRGHLEVLADNQAAYAPGGTGYYSPNIGDIVPRNPRSGNITKKTSPGNTGDLATSFRPTAYEFYPVISAESALWTGQFVSLVSGSTGPSYVGPIPIPGGACTVAPSGYTPAYTHVRTNASPYESFDGQGYNLRDTGQVTSGYTYYSKPSADYAPGQPLTRPGSSGNYFPIPDPSNLTFDQIFNIFLSGNTTGIGSTGPYVPDPSTPGNYQGYTFRAWKSWYTNSRWIKEPDGYVIYSYKDAYAARPSLSTP